MQYTFGKCRCPSCVEIIRWKALDRIAVQSARPIEEEAELLIARRFARG